MKHPYKRVVDSGAIRLEHIVLAERALGRALPAGAQVHHVNENKADNTPSNLVICPDAAYHALLHRRTKALDACGNANWIRCVHCKKYDSPELLRTILKAGGTERSYHQACNARVAAQHRAKLKKAA